MPFILEQKDLRLFAALKKKAPEVAARMGYRYGGKGKKGKK